MMTKSDFEAIAEAIFIQQDEADADRETIRSTAIRLAAVFANKNPRFDIDKFLTACGL